MEEGDKETQGKGYRKKRQRGISTENERESIRDGGKETEGKARSGEAEDQR